MIVINLRNFDHRNASAAWMLFFHVRRLVLSVLFAFPSKRILTEDNLPTLLNRGAFLHQRNVPKFTPLLFRLVQIASDPDSYVQLA